MVGGAKRLTHGGSVSPIDCAYVVVPFFQSRRGIGMRKYESTQNGAADYDHERTETQKRGRYQPRFKSRKKISFPKRNYRAERGSAFSWRCFQMSQARYTAARNEDSSALYWPARP